MFDKLAEVVKRFDTLTEKMADPELYNDKNEFKRVGTERANLEEVVIAYKEYIKCKYEISGAKEILKNEKDDELKEMAKEELRENESKIVEITEQIQVLLLPKDPLDDKNVMVEIRAGAGGDEASIFVGDVFRMYQNYFRDLGFKWELVSISQGDEGIKEVIFNVSGEKVYSKLKFESGCHRVQRVPKTESQGRVHTSTITVAVLPEPDVVEFELDMKDVRVDVYRSSGAGGQLL